MSVSRISTRVAVLSILFFLLLLMATLSLLLGAKSLPVEVVLEAFGGQCQSADCTIVLDARLPRTLAGMLAGGA
ncbi:iron chelate uptake ABC transporter family permease subunit, partial [Enterobacter sp. R1(2018)]|uniref:iron chelate uptake ABC transporter family permease subunit n=1 Tax=Enterobacter sp. R1(2018) TaxID=2447891 RepID=UPI00217E84EA